MDPYYLNGKEVIDSEGQLIGDFSGIEFDSESWKVTHICVSLSIKAINQLGYPQPWFLGKIIVDIPATHVQAISDVVTLNTSLNELQPVIGLHS